ncbi:MAG: PQQ-binding-like beta-propeller repeat protein, partial [Planctomycetes bacterium]|nr:PQQ-binding-like beta-propeller repeat protein [Planctomycetota bacterium]
MLDRSSQTLAVLLPVCLCTLSLLAEEPSFFRLNGGVTLKDDIPLPVDLGAKEVAKWQRKLPPGNSTPCIYGDRIFLTTFRADQKELATVALKRDTGDVLWRRVVPTKNVEPFHRTGSPATCTPACDGERVYVFFGSFGVLCYDLDGKPLWSKRMGPFQDEFGASSSPVLVDGKVILNQDHDIDNFIIALDQKTGKTVWKTPREGTTRSYSTPIIWEANGKKQIVVAGSLQLAAYDPANGKKLWWVNGLSRIVSPTPVQANGLLYVACWTPGGDPAERISMGAWRDAQKLYDKNGDGKVGKNELPPGAVLTRFFRIDLDQDNALDQSEWEKHARVFQLAQNAIQAIRPGGMGDVTESNVLWRYRKALPSVASPIVYKDVVYMVKDGGILTSLDRKTGKLLKQGRV